MLGFGKNRKPYTAPDDRPDELNVKRPPQGGSGSMPAPPRTRGELQVLLNEPIVILIGTQENPKRVEIREPSNAEFGEYIVLINAALYRMFKDNMPLILAAFNGDKKGVANASLNLAFLEDLMSPLVAKLVGENVDYVTNKMTARQTTAVLHAFLDVVGWEFIRESFRQAATTWKGTSAPTNESDEVPSWLTGSSSKSRT